MMETFKEFICKYHYSAHDNTCRAEQYGEYLIKTKISKFNGSLNKWIPFTGILYSKKQDTRLFTFFKDGMIHRLNGPAIILYNMNKGDVVPGFCSWYIYNNRTDPYILAKWYEENGIKINNMSEEDKTFTEMFYGNV